MNETHSIIWRRLDVPGHEAVTIYCDEDGRYIDGAAVFLYDGKACRLEYLIECDQEWQTTSATVDGWFGNEAVEHEIELTHGEWYLNDQNVSAIKGCTDIDLNFSPATNLLAVKRLNLEIGESKTTCAAWLRFPSFTLEPLEQTYTRKSEFVYSYKSSNGFETDLTVDNFGLPTEYGGIWIAETGRPQITSLT